MRSTKVSTLTLGTVQLGMDYGVANPNGRPDIEVVNDLLTTAVRGGINSFDTAMEYGESESVLGDFFDKRPQPYFVSKIFVPEDPSMSGRDLRAHMHELVRHSLARLRVKSLPLLLLHNTSALRNNSKDIGDGFRSLLHDGLIEEAGISAATSEPTELAEVERSIHDFPYRAVQVPVNLLDHRAISSGFIERLDNRGITIFARSIFLQGTLLMEPDAVPSYLSPLGEHVRMLRHAADSSGISVEQMAFSFVRDIKGIVSVVVGAETTRQVERNLELLNGPPLDPHVRKHVMANFGQLRSELISPKAWGSLRESALRSPVDGIPNAGACEEC